LLQRERLHQRALAALAQLTDYHERRGEYEPAQQYARHQLELDPWREESHRQLMRALALSGQRSAALVQYTICRRVLAAELDVEPEEETTALSERIQRGEVLMDAQPVLATSLAVYTPPTRLIGRETELAQLADRLEQRDCRLLTLVGPGGIGKTRLALQAAADLRASYRDGVCFVALAQLQSAEFVVPAIAGALGFAFHGAVDPKTQLLAYLRAKDMLLVLDNFEHLLSAAALVSELLAACPDLAVLATSRAPLHVRGEHQFPVPPLALPDLAQLPDVSRLTQYAAVALFVERAQAVQPAFHMTSATAPAVATICACLDGLPLAIELAAARSKLLPPQALLVRLDQTLKLLTGGVRDVPARQQTIRATIEWSYNLLTPAEQALFRRLAVFVGGWTIEAAEAVCDIDGDLGLDALDGLQSLVDNSLVRQEEGSDGEPRFRRLETIRAYALERLAAHGEAEALRERHLAYYLALAEAAEPHLRGAEQIVWADRLEQEHDNFRAALAWAHEHGAVDGSSTAGAEAELRLAGALFWFWYMRDYQIEGQRWLDRALARTNAPAHTPARARALFVAGSFAATQSDYVAGRARLEESVALWRELGDTRGLALALIDGRGLGWIALMERRVAEARALFAEGVALWREIGDKWGLAKALWSLGAAVRRDDPAAARPIVEEGVALYREVGDLNGLAEALPQLGIIARLEGDHTRAAALLEESLALGREVGDKDNISGALHCLGDVMQDQGDYERALALYQECVALARLIEGKEHIARCLVGIGGVASAVRQAERAARLLSAAETLLDSIGLSLAAWPEVRADYDRAIAAVRAQLDDATFAAAWAAGQALTLEQAITEALEG
jgi:predicted ATPase